MDDDRVHIVARAGFGEGTNELYDRSRPSYPDAALSALRQAIRRLPPFDVVEIGSGTGIFTRALLSHPDLNSAIGHLKAIDPSKGMRDTFKEKTLDKRVEVREGTFETTGVKDASADVVVVAQAWHWCLDYNSGMKEIARILRHDGVAFFIWNIENRDAAEWLRKQGEICQQYENDDVLRSRSFSWRATFTTKAYEASFELPQELSWDHSVPTTEKGVIDRIFSRSYVTQLSESDRSSLANQIRQVIAGDAKKEWLDQDRGVFLYPYKTILVVMRKKGNN